MTEAKGPWHCAWWSSWALGMFVAVMLFIGFWGLGFPLWATIPTMAAIRSVKELMWRSMLYEKAYRRK